MTGKVLTAPVPHKPVEENPSPSPAAARPMLNKEVKLDELSKYFHLPEKAVAKELGICLTSLKKLCRSYGITRWPFRKLKSLERTMKKVQTESDAVNAGNEENPGDPTGRAAAGEVKRKPYTVGNKTVFLSDEELEVFKMTMGKEACSELKPTPIATLEPALFNNATMAAASNALASVARGVPGGGGGAGVGTLGFDGESDPTSITAEVKGSNLVIIHWSTLWSQPQLKQKLLEPLNGAALRVSSDGVTAELDFRTEETAQRALRICRMAEMQAMQTSAPGNSMLYAGQSILQGGSSAGAAGAADAHPVSPPLSGSVHALLSDGCGAAGLMQPPSTHAQHSFWSSFLSSTQPATAGKENSSGGGSRATRTASSEGPKSIGALGDSLPSPPMSSTTMGMLLDGGAGGPLSMGAPMTNFFSSLFQSGLDAEHGGHGSSGHHPTSQPSSSNSLSAYLEDGKKEKKKDKDAKDKD